MNAPTLIILAVILALAGLCVWRIVRRRGGCECGSSGDCGGACAGCGHKAKTGTGSSAHQH